MIISWKSDRWQQRKVVLTAIFFTIAFSNLAASQEWSSAMVDGLKTAQMETDEATISVVCAANSGQQNLIAIQRGAEDINGEVGFTFDETETLTAIFEDNQMLADQDTNADIFRNLTNLLKLSSTVVATFGNEEIGEFPLSGSSAAIGDCSLPEVPFDLGNCEAVRGFGLLRQQLSNFTLTLALKDFCFDGTAGDLQGPINLSGFEVEIANPPIYRYTRGEYSMIELGPYTAGWTMQMPPGLDDGTNSFFFHDVNPNWAPVDVTHVDMTGFLYDEVAARAELVQNYKAGMAIDGIGFLVGDVVFTDTYSATIEMQEAQKSTSLTGMQGELILSIANDGKITGSGYMSGRTTGASEWDSMAPGLDKMYLNIEELGGFAVGETGQTMRALGIGQVSFQDEDGNSVISLVPNFELKVFIGLMDSSVVP